MNPWDLLAPAGKRLFPSFIAEVIFQFCSSTKYQSTIIHLNVNHRMKTMMDPGFLRRHYPSRWGRQPIIIWAFFSENCMKRKKFSSRGGACPTPALPTPQPIRDPPAISVWLAGNFSWEWTQSTLVRARAICEILHVGERSFPTIFYLRVHTHVTMAYKGGAKVQKVMVQPIVSVFCRMYCIYTRITKLPVER